MEDLRSTVGDTVTYKVNSTIREPKIITNPHIRWQRGHSDSSVTPALCRRMTVGKDDHITQPSYEVRSFTVPASSANEQSQTASQLSVFAIVGHQQMPTKKEQTEVDEGMMAISSDKILSPSLALSVPVAPDQTADVGIEPSELVKITVKSCAGSSIKHLGQPKMSTFSSRDIFLPDASASSDQPSGPDICEVELFVDDPDFVYDAEQTENSDVMV